MSGINPFYESDWFKYDCPKAATLVDRLAWRTKCNVVQRLKDTLFVVSPSNWASKMASESKVFAGVKTMCIHYPISETFEKACAKLKHKTRETVNSSKFVILFGATTGISLPIKGWDRLMAAIDLLTDSEREKISIKVFGCMQPSQKIHGVGVEFLGRLPPDQLVNVYRCADLFAFPSRSETWGQVKVEAMCCGTPVIAFRQTACADGISHMKNGWIAPEDDIESFADGIKWFMQQKEENGVVPCEGDAIREYGARTIGNKWKQFYEDILIARGAKI